MSRLQDDLLNDFRAQKKIILEQIELFDPLATSMRLPAAQRLMNKTLLVIFEVLCYLLSLGFIGFMLVMDVVYPFNFLSKIRYIKSIETFTQFSDAEYFSIAVHAMVGFIALLFFILARVVARIRLKNNILDLAGKNIKQLVGQHLNRKASIDAIEQRHFLELPQMSGHPDSLEIYPQSED